MNEIERMMYDCFPLFAKGFEAGECAGREQMTQKVLDFIKNKGIAGKCEITANDVLELYKSLK